MVVDAAMYGMAKGLSSGALILQQAEDKVRRLSATAADTVFDAAVPNALRERSRQLSRPFRSKAAPNVGLTVSHATSPFAKFLGKPDGCSFYTRTRTCTRWSVPRPHPSPRAAKASRAAGMRMAVAKAVGAVEVGE